MQLSVAAIPFMLSACPYSANRLGGNKRPAEITLPQQGNAQTFRDIERQLAEYDWGPTHYAACIGCPTNRDVTIRYTGMTKDIKADDGPAKLRVVALIENTSNESVEHRPSGVTFKPNTKYLMWVSRRNDKKAVWGYIELGSDYTSTPQAIGRLIDCNHRAPPNATDDADFKDCSDYAFFRPTQPAYGASNAAAYILKTGWIGCDPDCCTGTKYAAVIQ